MIFKKKIIFLITVLICADLFSACGKMEEDQNELIVDENLENRIPEINPQAVTDNSDLIEK